MTRGKYAAKANGQRAEVATNAVVALRGQIEQMRRKHAAEVAALKAQVDQLNGKLVSNVRELAAVEIQRVTARHDELLQAEREGFAVRFDRVRQALRDSNVKLPASVWGVLSDASRDRTGEDTGDASDAQGRRERRWTGKKFERTVAMINDADRADGLNKAFRNRFSVSQDMD